MEVGRDLPYLAYMVTCLRLGVHFRRLLSEITSLIVSTLYNNNIVQCSVFAEQTFTSAICMVQAKRSIVINIYFASFWLDDQYCQQFTRIRLFCILILLDQVRLVTTLYPADPMLVMCNIRAMNNFLCLKFVLIGQQALDSNSESTSFHEMEPYTRRGPRTEFYSVWGEGEGAWTNV